MKKRKVEARNILGIGEFAYNRRGVQFSDSHIHVSKGVGIAAAPTPFKAEGSLSAWWTRSEKPPGAPLRRTVMSKADDYIATIREKLLRAGIVAAPNLEGCSKEDIACLIRKIGVDLPAYYRVFLECCGRHAGDFMAGSDFSYSDIVGLQAYAKSFVAELGIAALPEQVYLVFLSHQGHSLLALDCTTGVDDPPVYRITEDAPHVSKAYDRFSDWLDLTVAEELATGGRAG